MSGNPVLLLIADSRCYNFNNTHIYPPSNILNQNINYVIKRGATIESILPEVIGFISNPTYIKPNTKLVTKIALGINNIVTRINTDTGNSRKHNHSAIDTTLTKLLELKQTIKNYVPESYISIATIAPAQLQNTEEQQQHLIDIHHINNQIITTNQEQNPHLHTPSLHSEILRTSKKKQGNGTNRTVLTIKHKHLYDGLHATSEIKHQWFRKLEGSFNLDLATLQ